MASASAGLRGGAACGPARPFPLLPHARRPTLTSAGASSSAVHRGNPAPRRASGPLSQGDPAHLAQTVHPSSSGPSVRADSAGTLQADVGVRGRDAPLGRSNDEGHPGVPGTSPFASDDDEDYRMTVVEGLTRQHVATTFRWPAALGGSQVSVTGSFCNWERLLRMTRSSSTGDFVLTLPLEPGEVQYKYVVDGSWRVSPADGAVRDECGTVNNQRLVAPTATVHWRREWEGDEIMITGSFNGWQELLPLHRPNGHPDWNMSLSLPPGEHWLQFLVNGRWMTSPGLPVGPNDQGHVCNRLVVDAPPAYSLFYATGWQSAVLNYRIPGHVDTWRAVELHRSPSRSAPAGGRWFAAHIPVPATVDVASAPPLEFFITQGTSLPSVSGSSDSFELENVRGKEDRPARNKEGVYVLPGPGGYKLVSGRITPFPRSLDPPMMVVSDLDGTMVGETPEADAATAAFNDYWENCAALCGSRLVYNTGRSIGQFLGLLQSKGGRLALPDVIITAVGTKIFHRSDRALRQEVTEAEWVEDKNYSELLDQGWDLGAVRRVAGRLVERGSGQCNWLDGGDEHPHRIALSVQVDALGHVQGEMARGLQEAGVEAQLIVSGEGSWRYLDVVAKNGGKLAALEYVREMYGIPRHRTLACGDSKNDILMLEGQQLSVAVGNSQPELVSWFLEQPQHERRIIYADGVFAYGILEGLCRHGLY